MVSEGLEDCNLSICGINCAKCKIYRASHGDDELRDEIVEWFRKERNVIVKPEKIRCEGCRGPLEHHWNPECKLMLCAKKRGHQYCFQCKEFPCTYVKEFSSDGIPHHRRTIENLKRMKEVGIDAWIAEQRRKGGCVFCP